MIIKLSGMKEVEIENHVNNANLILRDNNPFTNDKYDFNNLYYPDLIKFATALLKVAEEIK